MIPILLVSKDGKGRERYINDFVKTHSLTASSVFYYRKNPNVITIEQIREIQSFLTRTSRPEKLFIIDDFETARKATQSAFLKTLEESFNKAFFILVAADQGSILSTVVSRCLVKKIKLTRTQPTMLGKEDWLTPSLPQLFLTYTLKEREKAIKLCDKLTMSLVHMLKFPHGERPAEAVAKVIKEVLKTRNFIVKNNLNYQIALDHLLITTKKFLTIDKS